MASDVMAWRYLDQISPIVLLWFSPWGCGGPWFGYENFLSQKPSKGKTVAKGQIAGWNISYFTNLYFEFICSWKILYNKYLKGSSLSISNPMWNSKFALTKPLKCCSELLFSLILNPSIYPALHRINSLQTLTNCFFGFMTNFISEETKNRVVHQTKTPPQPSHSIGNDSSSGVARLCYIDECSSLISRIKDWVPFFGLMDSKTTPSQ